jgi:hypothetical protein
MPPGVTSPSATAFAIKLGPLAHFFLRLIGSYTRGNFTSLNRTLLTKLGHIYHCGLADYFPLHFAFSPRNQISRTHSLRGDAVSYNRGQGGILL